MVVHALLHMPPHVSRSIRRCSVGAEPNSNTFEQPHRQHDCVQLHDEEFEVPRRWMRMHANIPTSSSSGTGHRPVMEAFADGLWTTFAPLSCTKLMVSEWRHGFNGPFVPSGHDTEPVFPGQKTCAVCYMTYLEDDMFYATIPGHKGWKDWISKKCYFDIVNQRRTSPVYKPV
eukprot:SAG31_NODE_6261_length_2098_cov_1.548274_2_plen_173_part_00